MTQMTPGQVRVVDPILTTHAQGYLRPGNVGRMLFPIVEVGQYGGRVLTFGKEAFRRYNTKRAPGSATQRIQYGYLGNPYAITPSALEALVPDELETDAAAVPGIDMASDAVDMTLDVVELEHECECADIARDAGNYDTDHKVALTGASRWKGDSANPNTDIETAKEAVRASIGVKPNTVVLSPSAFSGAKNNANILDRIKYTGRDAVTTQMLANLWEVQNVIVGEAVSASGQDDTLSDVWGDDVIVAYVAPASGSNRRSSARPSYGYTYSIRGMPNVRQPYREENRKSWVYPVSADRTPVLSGMVAGYLIQNAGAAPT